MEQRDIHPEGGSALCRSIEEGFITVHMVVLVVLARTSWSSHISRFLNTGWRAWLILLLIFDNCFLTASADFWSLKGKPHGEQYFCWEWPCTSGFSDLTEVTKREIVDLDEGVGVLEVSKHRLGLITFRFERLPCGDNKIDHDLQPVFKNLKVCEHLQDVRAKSTYN